MTDLTLEAPATTTPTPDLHFFISMAEIKVGGVAVGAVRTLRITRFGEPPSWEFGRYPGADVDADVARVLERVKTDSYVAWVEAARKALAGLQAERDYWTRCAECRRSMYSPPAGEAA